MFTSELQRAYRTADIVLQTAFGDDKSQWPEIRRSLQLIERHYGALTGKNKAQMVREYGEEQVRIPYYDLYALYIVIPRYQRDQKKLPNVYKSFLKMISLEK